MSLIDKDENDENYGDVLQLLDDAEVILISTMLANQIRRYEHLGWYKEKGLKAVYERMKVIYEKLKTYEVDNG